MSKAVLFTKSAVIRKEGDEYVLYTKDGSRVLGRHSSRQKAIKQEYAIQKSQEKRAEPEEPARMTVADRVRVLQDMRGTVRDDVREVRNMPLGDSQWRFRVRPPRLSSYDLRQDVAFDRSSLDNNTLFRLGFNVRRGLPYMAVQHKF